MTECVLPGEPAVPNSSDAMKRAEVEAFVRLYGMSLQEACDLAIITPEEYSEAPPSPQSRIKFLPTPEMIKEQAQWFRENRTPDPDPDHDERGEDEFTEADNRFWYG